MLLAAGPLLAAFLSACGLTTVGGGLEIEVRAGERGDSMYFDPEVITVQTNAEITFVVTNEGQTFHEFESDEAGIEEIIIPSGRTRMTNWHAPSEPGVYPVYCDVPGHQEAGMRLTLVVEDGE